MSVEAAADAIARMREDATKPTVVGDDGRVISGPGRVNLLVVYLGVDGVRGTVIGFGGYGCIHTRQGGVRAGDTGVMLATEWRGKGYAAEAMRLAIEWGFASAAQGGLQLDKVTMETAVENAPMIGLLEGRLGLRGKGRRREAPEAPGREQMFYELDPEDWTRPGGSMSSYALNY
jgi:RimJ/RimL family protein N-acetyltransferase